MPLVVSEKLHLSYDGKRAAVDQVDFVVEAGSVFALVGPNGAGKTSTLRMLATLQPPSSGRLTIDGLDVAADPEGVRSRVGYLPDNFALYDQQTPVEYLEFFARLHGVPVAERRRRAQTLLEEFDLVDKRAARIQTLSRGMRQRLGIAKTLVHEPKLLLLDEPASALDPGARAKLKDALQALKRRGLAVIISSHILPDLADLADSVGVMEGGKMRHAGRIADAVDPGAATVYLVECESIDRARRALADFGSRVVAVDSASPTSLHVSLRGGGKAAADLLEALVLRGARPRHLAPRETALEAVYRATSVGAVA